ncbi:hypothetical protein MRX96_053365 [Rhipicephalus microplus]
MEERNYPEAAGIITKAREPPYWEPTGGELVRELAEAAPDARENTMGDTSKKNSHDETSDGGSGVARRERKQSEDGGYIAIPVIRSHGNALQCADDEVYASVQEE